MNSLTHERVREMISAGEISDHVQTHLDTCADCSEWNVALQRIRQAAQSVVPAAPADLYDRINATVAAGTVATPGGSWPRWLGVRALIAAAVAAAVAAVAVAVPRHVQGSDRGTRQIKSSLVAAIQKMESLHTALFDVDGEATLKLGKIIAFPTPTMSFPPGYVPSGFPTPALPSFPSIPPSAQGFSLSMHGTGETVLPDRWHLKGTVTGSMFGQSPHSNIEVISIGNDTWERDESSNGKWMHFPLAGGTRIQMDPAALLNLAKDHEAVDVGTETRDGTKVEHYRVSNVAGTVKATVDLWIGVADGIVREMNAEMSAGLPDGGGTADEHMHLRLHDLGANVSINAPDASDVVSFPEQVASGRGLFEGLNFSVSVSPQSPQSPLPPQSRSTYQPPTFSPPTPYSFRPYPTPTYPSESPYPTEPASPTP